MGKGIEIGQLSSKVQSMLESYRDDIADGIDDAAKKAASDCCKEIKANAERAFKSHSAKTYSKQWTTKQTGDRRGKAEHTVYCKKPGLPHLLENGHAKPGGGRVAGKPHIAPAAEHAAEAFQTSVEELIQNAAR